MSTVSKYDETNGWIFSEDAHNWMDNLPYLRAQTDADSAQYRRTGGYGKEYGLFGFKSIDNGGSQMIAVFT